MNSDKMHLSKYLIPKYILGRNMNRITVLNFCEAYRFTYYLLFIWVKIKYIMEDNICEKA